MTSMQQVTDSMKPKKMAKHHAELAERSLAAAHTISMIDISTKHATIANAHATLALYYQGEANG